MGGGLKDTLHKLNETLTVLLWWDAGDGCIAVSQRLQGVFKLLFRTEIGQSVYDTDEIDEFAVGRQDPTIVTLIERDGWSHDLLDVIENTGPLSQWPSCSLLRLTVLEFEAVLEYLMNVRTNFLDMCRLILIRQAMYPQQ